MKRITFTVCLALLFSCGKNSEDSTNNDSQTNVDTQGSKRNASTIGNGGDAVVCRDANGEITSAEVLDVYEGRQVYNLRPQSSSTSTKPGEYLKSIFRQLKQIDPSKYDTYMGKLKEFHSQIDFVDEALEDIPDHGDLMIIPGCAVEQLAIQRQVDLPGDKAYTINREIWNSLDVINQAALISHEIIYFDAINQNHINSVATRRFNMYLLSHSVEGWSKEEYQKHMIRLDLLDIVDIKGELELESPCILTAFSSGCIRFVTEGFPRGGDLKYVDRPELDNNGGEFEVLEIGQDGAPAKIRVYLSKDSYVDLNDGAKVKARLRFDKYGTTVVSILSLSAE